MNTYVSLTTISSRLDILKDCLDSLIHQSYPITKIFVTIPKRSMRGQKITDIPGYLYKQPYSDYVKVVRPGKDYGPIMKYIGSSSYVGSNDLIMVCDDDQRYHKHLLKTLIDKYHDNKCANNKGNNKVITSSGYKILCTDVAWGMGGLLMNGKTIKLIRDRVTKSSNYVKNSCQQVDDNWVAIILKRNNIPIYNLNLGDKRFVKGIAFGFMVRLFLIISSILFTKNHCLSVEKTKEVLLI